LLSQLLHFSNLKDIAKERIQIMFFSEVGAGPGSGQNRLGFANTVNNTGYFAKTTAIVSKSKSHNNHK
jgi:hypothetical protein